MPCAGFRANLLSSNESSAERFKRLGSGQARNRPRPRKAMAPQLSSGDISFRLKNLWSPILPISCRDTPFLVAGDWAGRPLGFVTLAAPSRQRAAQHGLMRHGLMLHGLMLRCCPCALRLHCVDRSVRSAIRPKPWRRWLA